MPLQIPIIEPKKIWSAIHFKSVSKNNDTNIEYKKILSSYYFIIQLYQIALWLIYLLYL